MDSRPKDPSWSSLPPALSVDSKCSASDVSTASTDVEDDGPFAGITNELERFERSLSEMGDVNRDEDTSIEWQSHTEENSCPVVSEKVLLESHMYYKVQKCRDMAVMLLPTDLFFKACIVVHGLVRGQVGCHRAGATNVHTNSVSIAGNCWRSGAAIKYYSLRSQSHIMGCWLCVRSTNAHER